MKNNMEHQQNGFSRFMKILKDYWFLIVFLGALIFTWAIFSTTVASHTEKIEKLENFQTATTNDIGDIKKSTSEIQFNLKNFLGSKYVELK